MELMSPAKIGVNSNIKLIIISPNNETLWYEHYNSNYERKEKVLTPNEEMIFKMNFNDIYITNQNGTNEWDWKMIGTYTVQARYNSHISLESDRKYFETK